MHGLALDFRNEMITVTWSTDYSSTDSLMEDIIGEEGGGKVVSQEFKLILLDGPHGCGSVRRLNAENGH